MNTPALALLRSFCRNGLWLIAAMMLTLLIRPCVANGTEKSEFYVSPSGSDTGDGSPAKPFRTIFRARDAVRGVPENFDGDIAVFLASGTYELQETLTFGSQDSGRGSHKIIYHNEPGAKVLISGGTLVSGWQKAGNGLWKAPLDRAMKLRTLYVNGQVANMASVEARGAPSGSYVVHAGQGPWAWCSGTKTDAVKYSRDLPVIERNPDDVEITSYHTWNTATVCVREVAREKGAVVLKLQQPYGAIAQTCYWANFNPDRKHRISNAFEFLKQPGQFYFDRAAKTVYYIPREDEDMTAACVVAPRLVHLIHFAGVSPSQRVRNVEFRGMTFAYSDWNLAEVEGSHGKAGPQGAMFISAFSMAKNWHYDIYRNTDVVPGAIELEHCEGIRFERNQFEHLAVEGLALPNDAQNVSIVGNIFSDTGGGAILLGHPQHAYEGDGPEIVHTVNGVSDAGPDKEKYTKEQERVCHGAIVANNIIRNPCREFLGHAGITAFFVEGARIEHNEISNTPFNGVSLGWGWNSLNGNSGSSVPGHPTTTAGNNRVSFNRFHHVMQKLHDSGAIYTLGAQPGTVIEGNYVQGVGDGTPFQDQRYGRHCDAGSAFIVTKDMVLDIAPCIWAIHGFHWGGQHDVPMDNFYTNSLRCSTCGMLTNLHFNPNNVWSSAAFAIIQRSGIEPAFDDLLATGTVSLADRMMPASVMTTPGERLPLPALLAAGKGWAAWAKEGGKAPEGRESGTSISAPPADGVYHLMASDASGKTTQSAAVLVVRSAPPVITGIKNGAAYTQPLSPKWEGLAYLDGNPMPLETGALIVQNGQHTLVAHLANGLETKVAFTLNFPQTWLQAGKATLKGDAVVIDDPSASGGKFVSAGKAGSVNFANVPAGRVLRVLTWAGQKQTLSVTINDGQPNPVALEPSYKPGVGQIVRYHVTTIPVEIPNRATLSLQLSPEMGLDAISISNQ
jgi:hypothetical protein